MLAYVSNLTLNDGNEPESIVKLNSEVAFTKPTLNILPSVIPIEQFTFSLINYTSEFNDIFDTIVYFTNIQRQPLNGTFGLAYLLKSARIEVTTESVRATTNFEGDFRLDVATYNSTGDVNLLARTARFYDTIFYIGDLNYNVVSGDININFDIDRNFFLGQGQAPFFSLRGYNATGNVKLALNPVQYASLTGALGSYQLSGVLLRNAQNIGVSIANNGLFKNLNLGTAFVINKIEFSMQQNSIITATLEFNAFFNSSTAFDTF